MSLGRMGWDGLSWIVGLFLAVAFRYDFYLAPPILRVTLTTSILLAMGQMIVGSIFRIYQGRYRLASFDEVSGLFLSAGTVGAIATIITFATRPSGLPRSSPAIATAFAVLLMLAGRFLLRLARRQGSFSENAVATLIYGAGESGSQITRLFAATSESPYRPIGFIDDDPAKRRLHMNGLRVLGTLADLDSIVRSRNVGVLVVAIAGIDSPRLLELDRRCASLGITLRVIPTATEIVGGAVSLGDISQVTEEDLLGRRPINTDEESISSFIEGKRVLITGAGGSIGSELARQVSRYQPSFLGLLDRDESALQAVQLSLDGRGLLDSDELFLADIRDPKRIHEIFEQTKPDVVFHAAALKHLPLLQAHPAEGFKTNVQGTANVLIAARDLDVPVLINISTDKAADPTSVLGSTKLLTEQMTAGLATPDRRYLSVRFGNVLGSRGSVLNTFRQQIATGGPVTVTDPSVTRYFMTISEAVHLVLQAAAIGQAGETLVLDMGEPVRIKDVAEHMISRSGRSISIEYTGLRPGEKIHEVLLSENEKAHVGAHPLIRHICVNGISISDALQSAEQESGPSST